MKTEKSLEPISSDTDQTMDIAATFDEALQALDILIAQQGNPRIRDLHKHTIRDYLMKQEEMLNVYRNAAKMPLTGLYKPVNGNFTRLEQIRLLAVKIEGMSEEIRRLEGEVSNRG
jgi:hypothetical protein